MAMATQSPNILIRSFMEKVLVSSEFAAYLGKTFQLYSLELNAILNNQELSKEIWYELCERKINSWATPKMITQIFESFNDIIERDMHRPEKERRNPFFILSYQFFSFLYH